MYQKQLCVNIDHVATLRQARQIGIPSVIEAAKIVETSGTKGITIHLREDRRHIQDSDVYELRSCIRYLNLEMANTPEMVGIAIDVKPNAVCLVPEKRAELTTEGGLNVILGLDQIKATVERLTPLGILVSLFVEPDLNQIEAAFKTGAQIVELHTGKYAETTDANEIERLRLAAQYASNLGLIVHAGHGLSVENLSPIVQIPEIEDLNIGFSLISRALFVGLNQAIVELSNKINNV